MANQMIQTSSVNFQLSKKGFHISYISVCSLPNKMNETCNMLNTNDIHVLAITESHLDSSITDGQVHVDGYNLIRKDRNRNGGGVAMYIQNHLPFKKRDDLTVNHLEAIWIQIHLPFQNL